MNGFPTSSDGCISQGLVKKEKYFLINVKESQVPSLTPLRKMEMRTVVAAEFWLEIHLGA